MSTVTLYGRPGCHLCEDARAVLRRVRRAHEFTLQERNIEDDETLLLLYLERIPVVTIDGVESFDLHVDEAAFVAALRAREAGTSMRARS